MKQSQQISSSGLTGKPVLIYLNREKVILNLPFILTEGKILKVGFPYLKSEERFGDPKIEAVRLLDVWDFYGFVYLKIQNLTTLKVDTLSWNLEYSGDYWLWSLVSLNYIRDMTYRKNSNALYNEKLLEFDF